MNDHLPFCDLVWCWHLVLVLWQFNLGLLLEMLTNDEKPSYPQSMSRWCGMDSYETVSWEKFIMWLLSITYVSICWGHHNKILQNGWLKQQKFTSHSSGSWEVWDQGTRQFDLWWEPPFWLIDGPLLIVSSHVLSSVNSQGGGGGREREREISSIDYCSSKSGYLLAMWS